MRLKFTKPMEPELVDTPPEGDEWIHEIKFDGYRTQVIKDDDGIRLMTKNGYEWTGRYIQLAGEAAAIEAKDFIIDGEAITINEAGLSDSMHCNQPSRAASRRETSIWWRSISCTSTATICATCRWKTAATSSKD